MDRITYIDDTEIHENKPDFTITAEEAEQLNDFLEHEYISQEFYPLVINVVRRLRDYVEE